MNLELPSYGKVFTIGHRAIASIFDGEVEIQEKVDGSQFSFGLIDGKPFCRSRNTQLNMDDPEGMFKLGVDEVKRMHHDGLLNEGLVYRGEFLAKPKHNTISYSRVPKGHIVLFGIDDLDTNSNSSSYDLVKFYSEFLGLEAVPLLFKGRFDNPKNYLEFLRTLMDAESFLGGAKMEGVVVKNHSRFDSVNHRPMKAKLVSDSFKEKHKVDWKKSNPTKKDAVQMLIQSLTTEARWRKALERMRDSGEDIGVPECIGKAMVEIQSDVIEEEVDYIKDSLYNSFIGDIKRGVTRGFPEWFKERLVSGEFQ